MHQNAMEIHIQRHFEGTADLFTTQICEKNLIKDLLANKANIWVFYIDAVAAFT
jgi:hypothetical protein